MALAGCGGGSPSAGVLTGKSARQILTAATDAAEAEAGVHYQLDSTEGSEQETITGDAGLSEGQQERVIGSDEVEAELIDDTAYLQGNAGGLADTFGLSSSQATKYAGKWISVAPSDSLYSSISESVTLDTLVGQLLPTGSLTQDTPTTLDGQQVIPVRGGLPGQVQKGVTGSAVLYVDTKRPTVPVGFSGEAAKSGEQVTDDGAFSEWGEQIDLSAPSSPVPYSDLSGS